ncbi:MAG: hypothetical protein WC028_23745 [Candidatus Obscuribacterales bacterium]|jgi:hypothetical protein
MNIINSIEFINSNIFFLVAGLVVFAANFAAGHADKCFKVKGGKKAFAIALTAFFGGIAIVVLGGFLHSAILIWIGIFVVALEYSWAGIHECNVA